MFFLFFLIWLILNGRVTLEIVLFGLIISAVLYFFMCRFMGHTLRKEGRFFRKLGYGLAYAAYLVRDIFTANFQVLRFLLSPKYEVEPVLVRFRVPLKNPNSRTALANSITITPGTITVTLEEDEYLVHCLDKSLADGLQQSKLIELLYKMEA